MKKKNIMKSLIINIIPILSILLLFGCGDSSMNPFDSIINDENLNCMELTGSCEKNAFGNFRAMGTVSNHCDDKSFSSVTIEFEFSGGTETRTFNKNLSAGHKYRRTWTTKIKGHKNEDFLGMRILSVK